MDKYSEQRKVFTQWLSFYKADAMPEFKACISAFENWVKEMLNAFNTVIQRSTEGFNNKIKVPRRISYGIKNFICF